MRAFARASILAAALLLPCVIAPPAAAARTIAATVPAAGSSASVVIHAADGRPARMPTYAGPDGVRVPAGACAAVQGGRVWILPCADPRVVAYTRATALAARRQRRVRIAWSAGGLLAGLAAAGAVLWWRRRYGRSVEVGE